MKKLAFLQSTEGMMTVDMRRLWSRYWIHRMMKHLETSLVLLLAELAQTRKEGETVELKYR